MSKQVHNDPNSGRSGPAPIKKVSCEEWEALLVDYLDEALQAADGEAFHMHRESCAACAEMFSQAEQGREWLKFLRVEPEAPPALVARILAETSGAEPRIGVGAELAPAAASALPATAASPFWKRGGIAYAGRRVAQPRLLMTAAMAFFSITLTLNMAGIRLNGVHIADLKPQAISTSLDKQYHMASARVVRYYDNLRFVYEMEAQVRELRRNADLDDSAPASTPANSPGGSPADRPSQGAPASPDRGGKNGGKSQAPADPNQSEQPRAQLWGEKIEAAMRSPLWEQRGYPQSLLAPRNAHDQGVGNGIESGDSSPSENPAAGQAERGIA